MKAVLLAIGLRLNERQALGDAVNGASRVGKAFEEILFAKRDRSIGGVRGGAAEANHFFDAVTAGSFHELHGHHYVVVEAFGDVAMAGWIIDGGREMESKWGRIYRRAARYRPSD